MLTASLSKRESMLATASVYLKRDYRFPSFVQLGTQFRHKYNLHLTSYGVPHAQLPASGFKEALQHKRLVGMEWRSGLG
jgi:hypothetical protein